MYVNSLWEPYFSLLPLILSALRILPVQAVLLAPRGELSVGALSLKARKKRWFLRVWRPLLSHVNLTWHASTEMEAATSGQSFPPRRSRFALVATKLSHLLRPLEHQSSITYLRNLCISEGSLRRRIFMWQSMLSPPSRRQRPWTSTVRSRTAVLVHVRAEDRRIARPHQRYLPWRARAKPGRFDIRVVRRLCLSNAWRELRPRHR